MVLNKFNWITVKRTVRSIVFIFLGHINNVHIAGKGIVVNKNETKIKLPYKWENNGLKNLSAQEYQLGMKETRECNITIMKKKNCGNFSSF